MLRRARAVLFWCHLAVGVAAGAVVLMMCVTGVALAYQRQVQWWADTRHFRAEPPPGGQRAPVADLLAAAGTADPDTIASTITFRADPTAPAAVLLGTRTVFVNPYTAHVYGEGTGAGVRRFFAAMVDWHRYVARHGDSRPTGKAITGAATLACLVVVLSGLYLWWPAPLRWAQVRQAAWFRRGVSGRDRHLTWHHTLGFWAALPLALIVGSGVVIAYPWATNLVYRAMGEPPPPAVQPRQERRPSAGAGEVSPASEIDLDRLILAATAFQPDWNVFALRVPAAADAPVTVAIDRGDGGQAHLRGTLTLDANGRVETWEGVSSLTPGRRAFDFLRGAHTGEVAGLAGQTLAGMASAAGAVLVYTGMALAFQRVAGRRGRRVQPGARP